MSLRRQLAVDADPLERALDGDASSRSHVSGDSDGIGSGRSTAASRTPARSSPRPWPGRSAARCRPTAATSRQARLANASVVRIASAKSASPSGASARGRRARSRSSPSSSSSGTPITPVEATATAPSLPTPAASAAAPCILAASSSPRTAGGGVGVAGVDDDRADRVQAAALAAQQHRRGLRAGAGEAGGAGRPRRTAGQSPRSERAAGLEPAGDARGPKSLGQAAGELGGVVGRLDPARGEERARGGHSMPSPSGRPNIRLRFWIACDAAPFHRLSIAPNTIDPAGALVAVHRDTADVGLAHVADAGRLVGELDERLVRVRVQHRALGLFGDPVSTQSHVTRHKLALVERNQVRRERDLHVGSERGQLLLDLRRVAMPRDAVGVEVLVDGDEVGLGGGGAAGARRRLTWRRSTSSPIRPARASGASASSAAVG